MLPSTMAFVHFLVLAPLLAFAQSTQTVSVTSTNPSLSSTATSSLPVVSLFIPIINIPGQISASVITGDISQTVYAFAAGAMNLTLTEGASTLLFSSSGASANCTFSGATPSANVPATAATCAGTTLTGAFSGVATISTLSGNQIRYVPVTVTAGAAALQAASTASPTASSTTTTTSGAAAAGPARTGFPGAVGAVAAVGMIGIGLL